MAREVEILNYNLGLLFTSRNIKLRNFSERLAWMSSGSLNFYIVIPNIVAAGCTLSGLHDVFWASSASLVHYYYLPGLTKYGGCVYEGGNIKCP